MKRKLEESTLQPNVPCIISSEVLPDLACSCLLERLAAFSAIYCAQICSERVPNGNFETQFKTRRRLARERDM